MARFPQRKRFALDLIAKNEDVPEAFLRKIFQRLSQARILDSQRGRNGGFNLLKRPSQISLREILESVQGKCALSDCLLEKNLCRHSRTCGINRELGVLQKRWNSLLESYTLQDFTDSRINNKGKIKT